MPLHVGDKSYPKFKDLVEHIKRSKPGVEDPNAYAATIARNVEPNFDKMAHKAKGGEVEEPGMNIGGSERKEIERDEHFAHGGFIPAKGYAHGKDVECPHYGHGGKIPEHDVACQHAQVERAEPMKAPPVPAKHYASGGKVPCKHMAHGGEAMEHHPDCSMAEIRRSR